ncbi:MAG TPA: hypothetical protein VGP31_03110, partial [Planosporangium sp.]|nr:hypothetical protein [Planosporangium sp.]
MRERRLRILVEQFAGGDQVTSDSVRGRLPQTAQLVAYLGSQVTRVDVLRRGQRQARTVRLVATAPVAPGRSARSAVTVAVATDPPVLPEAAALAGRPVIPEATSPVSPVSPESTVTVTAESPLVPVRTIPAARDVNGRLLHGARRRGTGARLYRLVTDERTPLANGTRRGGVIEVNRAILARLRRRRPLGGRTAPPVLGTRTALAALVTGLARTALLAVPTPATVAVTAEPPVVPGPTVAESSTLIAAGAAPVTAAVVPALRPGSAILEPRTVTAVTTTVAVTAGTPLAVTVRAVSPVPVPGARTIIAVPAGRTAPVGTATLVPAPVRPTVAVVGTPPVEPLATGPGRPGGPTAAVVGTWPATGVPVRAEPGPSLAAFPVPPVRTLLAGWAASSVIAAIPALRPVGPTAGVVAPPTTAVRPTVITAESSTATVTTAGVAALTRRTVTTVTTVTTAGVTALTRRTVTTVTTTGVTALTRRPITTVTTTGVTALTRRP